MLRLLFCLRLYTSLNMPAYTIPPVGSHYVNKYSDVIEKYAQQYNVDPDLVKAIMYNEGATGHKGVFHYLGDFFQLSDSPMPMNIQCNTIYFNLFLIYHVLLYITSYN